MSVFLDDDLKRLKEDLEKHGSDIFEPIELWQALLARLEAAENIIEYSAGHDEDCDEVQSGDKCSCEYDKLYEAWRKAAGK